VNYIDANRHSLALSSGRRLRFSKLVLALGVEPKKLDLPGADLQNIFTLRVPSDANNIAHLSTGKRVVCVGGSFVGMEIASALAAAASHVTVICDSSEPMKILGPDIGVTIRKYFERMGVRVMVNSKAVWFVGQGQVSGVQLESGETVNADVVVVAIGSQPSTNFLKGSQVEMDQDGFITVDSNFRTSVENVYAIGDAVKFPLPQWNIESINIAHVQAAQSHGQMLAYTIEGKQYPHDLIPFFMVKFFLDCTILFAGCPQGATLEVIHGDLAALDFAKYYLM
ncbi:Pyridine nucleotide-disulfide oxidoreductase, partial [Trichostrongylus colubriformis]